MKTTKGTIWSETVTKGLVWEVSKVMLAVGYKQNQGDHTLFIKHSKTGGVTTLLVYVDDIIMTGDDASEQEMLK